MTRQSFPDNVLAIAIAEDAYIREAWEIQKERAVCAGTSGELMLRLSKCLVASVTECLDPDLKPPTSAQIVYATDIAKELGLEIPQAAVRYRGAMAEFIESHVGSFNAKRRRQLLGARGRGTGASASRKN